MKSKTSLKSRSGRQTLIVSNVSRYLRSFGGTPAVMLLLVVALGCCTTSNAATTLEEKKCLNLAQEVVAEMGFRPEPLGECRFLMWVGQVSVSIGLTNHRLTAEIDVNAELLDGMSAGTERYHLLRVENDQLGRRKVWLRSDMPKQRGAPTKEAIRSWLRAYLQGMAEYLKEHAKKGSTIPLGPAGATADRENTETAAAAAGEPKLSDLKGSVVEKLLSARGLPWERDERISGIAIKRAKQPTMLIVHWNFDQMNSFDFFMGPATMTEREIPAFNRKARYLEMTPSSNGKTSAHAKLRLPANGVTESEFKSWLYGCLDDAELVTK